MPDIPNTTVSRLLLEYLKLEGVDKVFGVPGAAVIALLDDLHDQAGQQGSIDFVVCRHETGAAYMAHGYAIATGGLGVVLTTAGPSSTNALTGVMNAEASGAALLHIAGEIPTKYFGMGYLQEGVDAKLDMDAVYRNSVSYSALISSADSFETLIKQALRTCMSQPRRAAHISLANDTAASCLNQKDPKTGQSPPIDLPSSPAVYRTVPSGTDRALAEAAVHDLAAAAKPLLFLGNGARLALSDPHRLTAFTSMVERHAWPVMTTPDAKGIFPEGHDLSLRNYGMTACSWPDLYMLGQQEQGHFDALCVFGSALGELATSVIATDHWSKNLIPSGPFIQVDLDQGVIGRDFPITRGIVGDVGATLDAMIEAAEHVQASHAEQRRAAIAAIKAAHSPFSDPAGRASTTAPTHPAALVRVMNEVITDGHIVIDAGNCVGWSLNFFEINAPVQYHSALDMGPMGFAVGAVVGTKLGNPDIPSVALVGDGAFMMHGAEISTAAQYNVGAVWVVLNDNDLGMVSQGMGVLYPPADSWVDYYKLGAPDLVAFSQGLGADAVAITRDQGPAEFEQALRTALVAADTRQRPQVIVVHIDTTPMPPYGWPTLGQPDC